MEISTQIIVSGIPLLIAVILHEVAHGKVAEWLGDPTARQSGRITLNPIKHVDPVMTLLLPGLLIAANSPFIIGGAKPVPVDPRYFRHPRRGMGLVAIAGPITNLILAVVFIALFKISLAFAGADPAASYRLFLALCASGVVVNVVLAVFNMFPIPPLDGGRVVSALLPESAARSFGRLERFGFIIIIALLYFGVLQKVLEPVVGFVYSAIFGTPL